MLCHWIYVNVADVRDLSPSSPQVKKFGDPNGIVRFDGVAQIERTFDEPADGHSRIVFPIYRREGTIGTLQVRDETGRGRGRYGFGKTCVQNCYLFIVSLTFYFICNHVVRLQSRMIENLSQIVSCFWDYKYD